MRNIKINHTTYNNPNLDAQLKSFIFVRKDSVINGTSLGISFDLGKDKMKLEELGGILLNEICVHVFGKYETGSGIKFLTEYITDSMTSARDLFCDVLVEEKMAIPPVKSEFSVDTKLLTFRDCLFKRYHQTPNDSNNFTTLDVYLQYKTRNAVLL